MICKSMFYFIHNFFLWIIIFVVFCYQLTQKIGRLENDHYDKLLFYMVLITSLESLSQLFETGKFARGDNSTITITRIKLWRKLRSMDFNNIILIEWQVTQMNCRWIEIHKVYNGRVKHVLYLSLTLFTDSISNDFINRF